MRGAHRIVAVACLVWVAQGWAQNVAVPASDPLDEELTRIGAVRQKKTAEFDAQDAACLARFAVTDCQNKVTVRRRKLLADLKRQEDVVRNAQRYQKAQEQLQRSADKAAENAQRQSDIQAAQMGKSVSDRQKTQDEKILSHQLQAKPAGAKASEPKIASGLDADAQAKNRAAFEKKQQAAQKRRQDRDQRLKDQGNGGPPLPVAP